MIQADYDKYVRQYGATMSLEEFAMNVWSAPDRAKKKRRPKAMEDWFRALTDPAPIDERVRTALLKSLSFAGNPKPKDALIRMREQGAISNEHIKAWEKMRNTGAHGGLLGDSDVELQKHLNRYFLVLDLFYRLMFVAVGYRGPHIDYSKDRWPESSFLGSSTT
jgi:hypothetical protein